MKNWESLKGIPPGKFIQHKLNKLNISQREFAKIAGFHSQTLNAVINGHRKLTIDMALKLEENLDLEEGFLLMLQTYYLINKHKHLKSKEVVKEKPQIRKVLFWDTDFEKINWQTQKNAVMKRVMERGNIEEKEEIIKFYNKVQESLNK